MYFIFIDGSAPLGFEPEGKCGSPEGGISPTTPSCLRWARNLSSLLSDPEGVNLFRSYLAQEVPTHANPLDFWFACEGLRKQTDPERIAQFVKVIFRYVSLAVSFFFSLISRIYLTIYNIN
jgi:axin 1